MKSCWLIFSFFFLLACGPEDLPIERCPSESVFGQGAHAPWLPKWSSFLLHSHLDRFFEQPILMGTSSDPNACEPDQWEDGQEFVLETLGPTTAFLCFGDQGRCMSQIARYTFETVSAFGPPANEAGSVAVSRDDARISSWSHTVVDFQQGTGVDERFQSRPSRLSEPTDLTDDVLVLGSGGQVTVELCTSLENGDGPDFVVFENGVNDQFLEIAFVEVSSDGLNFVRFPTVYANEEPVGPYGGHDSSRFNGFAGQFRFGFGTPFELEVLAGHPMVEASLVDLNDINFVRIIDIVGNGQTLDSMKSSIYDPYPTFGSAGFDLYGIALMQNGVRAACP